MRGVASVLPDLIVEEYSTTFSSDYFSIGLHLQCWKRWVKLAQKRERKEKAVKTEKRSLNPANAWVGHWCFSAASGGLDGWPHSLLPIFFSLLLHGLLCSPLHFLLRRLPKKHQWSWCLGNWPRWHQIDFRKHLAYISRESAPNRRISESKAKISDFEGDAAIGSRRLPGRVRDYSGWSLCHCFQGFRKNES